MRAVFFRPLIVLALAGVFLSVKPGPGAAPGIGVSVAQAQSAREKPKRNLIDLLFRRNKAKEKVQQAPRRDVKRARVAPQSQSQSNATASEPTPEKVENALVILVVGDFTAGGLASGLETAFEKAPAIVIEARSKGSSGLVRDDYYDWNASVGPIIEEVDPALVVVMIGSNDRQPMRVDGKTEQVRSEAWVREYKARIERLAQSVRKTNTPLIWVGGPPYRFKSMSADILAFNEFYRAAVESAGGTFVDIWDGFVDQDGNFITRGSDINGQTVSLRNSDGINFTTAGKRKLAFYVERQIKQMFGDAASSLLTVLAPESYSPMHLPPLLLEEDVERIDPIPVGAPELDGGTALLGDIRAVNQQNPESPLKAKSARKKLVEDGVPPPGKPGRANDFKWPPA